MTMCNTIFISKIIFYYYMNSPNPNKPRRPYTQGPWRHQHKNSETQSKTPTEVARLVRVHVWGMQELKVLGSNPAAVYWLLDFCVRGVLQPDCNRQLLGTVLAASPLRHPLSRLSSPRTGPAIRASELNQPKSQPQNYHELEKNDGEF